MFASTARRLLPTAAAAPLALCFASANAWHPCVYAEDTEKVKKQSAPKSAMRPQLANESFADWLKSAEAASPARTRRKILGGNWKSNPSTLQTVGDLCKSFSSAASDATDVECVIFPTALHGPYVQDCLGGSGIEVGVQNISKTGNGAFTGEWTADMAAEVGYSWTLIGHSERRTRYGETDADAGEKCGKALNAGLRVILCIGETLDERERGMTDEVNRRQLKACIPFIKDWDRVVLAYEPVWAIGTGKVATPDQAQEAHAAIRAFLASACGPDVAAKVRIQYGGSASPGNCGELISKPDIDGFLVGGASLKPEFMKMVATCATAP